MKLGNIGIKIYGKVIMSPSQKNVLLSPSS